MSLCKLQPSCPVLIWQGMYMCGLQGLTCGVFRCGILHRLVVKSAYLSYCSLPIIPDESAHSPLTSSRCVCSHSWCSLEIFFFFPKPFSVKRHVWSHLNLLSCPFWYKVQVLASRLTMSAAAMWLADWTFMLTSTIRAIPTSWHMWLEVLNGGTSLFYNWCNFCFFL